MTALSLPMTLSTLRVIADVTPEFGYRTRQAQFGDGYIARRLDGLNPLTEEWPVQTPPLLMANILTLEAELKALGAQPFMWTAPGDTEAKFWFLSPVKWRRVPHGHAYASLTFNIKRYYGGGGFNALPAGTEDPYYNFLWCRLVNVNTNDNSVFVDIGPQGKTVHRLNGLSYVESTPSLTIDNEWTVEFMVKPLQSYQTHQVALWDYNPAPPIDNAQRITIGLDQQNRIFLRSKNNYFVCNSGASLTANAWHSVALSVGWKNQSLLGFGTAAWSYGWVVYVDGTHPTYGQTNWYGGAKPGLSTIEAAYNLGAPAGGASMYIGRSPILPMSGQDLQYRSFQLSNATGSTSPSRFFYVPGATSGTSTLAAFTIRWYHIALSVVNGICKVFIDGVLFESGTWPTLENSQIGYLDLFAHTSWPGATYGYIDECRITGNIGRYTTNFTVPTSAFALDSTDPYASNVLLLMHMEGTADTATFTNSVSNGLSVVPSGDIRLSSAQSKFGTTSCLCNAADQKLTVPITSLVGDFTFECWWRPVNSEPNGQERSFMTIVYQNGIDYGPQAKIDRVKFYPGANIYNITDPYSQYSSLPASVSIEPYYGS